MVCILIDYQSIDEGLQVVIENSSSDRQFLPVSSGVIASMSPPWIRIHRVKLKLDCLLDFRLHIHYNITFSPEMIQEQAEQHSSGRARSFKASSRPADPSSSRFSRQIYQYSVQTVQ